MSSIDEDRMVFSLKPYEIKLADVLFLAMRKHLMIFKDLSSSKYIHYTMVVKGSLIDFHKTLEDQGRHIPLVKIEFDWQFLLNRVREEIKADLGSIFHIVKTSDPRWENLEVEFMPIQVGMELLSPIVKGVRWNIDEEFLQRLENSVNCARLGELADGDLIIGTGSGYLVICNGVRCFLFNTDRMSKIIDKNFELSIRKIHLKHYTLGSTLWYVKIQLLNFVYSAIRHLRRLMP